MEGISPKEHAEDGGEKERQEIYQELLKAKAYLEEWLGIDDLTTIEAVRLRRIVEQCMKENEEQERRRDMFFATGDQVAAHRAGFSVVEVIPKEASRRWLIELYGISFDDLPNVTGKLIYRFTDMTKGKNYVFKNHHDAKEKRDELNAAGHTTNFIIGASSGDEKLKEYIKILREKAHMSGTI